MRIYIFGNDGITLCHEAPATMTEGEIAVASKQELQTAPLSGSTQRGVSDERVRQQQNRALHAQWRSFHGVQNPSTESRRRTRTAAQSAFQ